jgi:hypothetical protein
MSLRSVPDARTPVPMLWWLPVTAFVVLVTITVAVVVASSEVVIPLIAIAVSVIGYLLVWWRIRPAPLRTGPYSWLTTGGLIRDRTDPPTVVIPAAVARLGRRPGRAAALLVNSAAVGLGFGFVWSFLIALTLHSAVPRIGQARSAMTGFYVAVLNALFTSVLEECGIALLILAVAGAAQRYLPSQYDDRSVAVYAILLATVTRTALHIPLWGLGAVGRLGLSLALAWLFWRTRRIWPLILAHTVWDTLILQSAVSPTPAIRTFTALAVFAWAITGAVIAIIAIVHTRQDIQSANHYYRYRQLYGPRAGEVPGPGSPGNAAE